MELLIFGYFAGLALGFTLLWFSGGWVIKYSVKTANLFHVTTLFIGFFLVVVAKSLPVFAVIFISAIKNAHEILVVTIIGSLIADIGFALGITSFFVKSISITKKDSRNMVAMLVVSTIIMILLFYIKNLNNLIGLFLIFTYLILIWWIWRDQATLKEAMQTKEEILQVVNSNKKRKFFWTSKSGILIKLFLSLVLMFFASEIIVRFIIKIADYFSYSRHIIGATISGMGTSIPELTLGISAVRKKELPLALGNIIGSVLGEATFLLGAAVLVSPTIVNLKELNTLIPFLFLSLGIAIYALARNNAFKRVHGILVFIVFITFMIYHLFF